LPETVSVDLRHLQGSYSARTQAADAGDPEQFAS